MSVIDGVTGQPIHCGHPVPVPSDTEMSMEDTTLMRMLKNKNDRSGAHTTDRRQ